MKTDLENNKPIGVLFSPLILVGPYGQLISARSHEVKSMTTRKAEYRYGEPSSMLNDERLDAGEVLMIKNRQNTVDHRVFG